MQEFLQALRERYGDISAYGILSRQKNFGEDLNFGKDFKKVEQNKFSPVNIETCEDWIKLRANAADLYDLKTFFAGRSDSQSPQFLNMIEQYQKFISKNLSTPEEIEAESATDFVAKLSDTIKKWFYNILEAVRPGLQGKGSESVKYYEEINSRVEKYFARIGLKAANVQPRSNFSEWLEKMTAIETPPRTFTDRHNTIAEIFIQPRYFEYYNDEGEIEKSWIEGKCAVFKR